MLKKNNKVKKETFKFVFKEGRIHNSKNMILRVKNVKNWDEFGISFVVPKKIEKSPVKRNFIKRRGYYIIRKLLNSIKTPFVGLFIIKRISDKNNFLNFEDEIVFLLKKEGLI